MGIQIASLFASIGADTSKLDTALTGSKSKLTSMKDGLNSVVKDLTGFNASTLTVAAGVGILAKGLKDSVDQYYAYTQSIQKMADSTGMATEQISRIVQVADDFRVEQGTVETAMKMALQNGFNPTIENLATLSDRYVSLADPTARAAEMQKIFGRQWAEMVPLLAAGGDAIRSGAASISGAMVVTEKAAEEAKKYYEATDALNDAFTNLKYGVAKDLIPALTNAATAMNTLMTASDKVTAALSQHGEDVSKAAGSYQEYIAEMQRSYGVTGKVVEVTENGIRVFERHGQRMADVTDKYNLLSEAEYNAAKASGQVNAAMKETAEYSGNAEQRAMELLDATTNVGLATDITSMKMRDYLTSLQDTDAATRNLTSAMTEFSKQTLYAAAAEGLSAADALNLAKSMGLVDEKSMYATQKIAGWKEELAAGTITLQEYNALVYSLGAGLGALESKHLTITLDYIETHSTSKDYRHGGAVDDNMAGGGQFVIPPGYPNDTYPLGPGKWGQSGETVTVTPAGQGAAHANGVTVNMYADVSGAVDIEQMAYRVAAVIKDKGR